MSYETWYEEFVDLSATDFRTAVKNTVKKFKGLLPENLSRHGLRQADFRLVDDHGEKHPRNAQKTCPLCMLWNTSQVTVMQPIWCVKCADAFDLDIAGNIYMWCADREEYKLFEEMNDPHLIIDALERWLAAHE